MNDSLFFEYEDEDYGPTFTFDIKFPNPLVIEPYLFALEYRFPDEYYAFIKEIEEEGLVIADHYAVVFKYAMDAIKSGMIRPTICKNDYDNIDIYIQYWSPLNHKYMDFDDMSIHEIEWLHMGLVTRIWSYN